VEIREVGRRLRVSVLLEGSVRKSGERLRIAVRLMSATSGHQLWSAVYDRDTADVFALQDEVARAVADALEITLGPKDKAVLRTPPTSSLQAYDCYLRGRKFYYGYGPREMEFALQLFTRAIGFDPDYALAYAGLADCWSYIYLYAERSETVRLQAEWAGQKAVELAPHSAQAHVSQAIALSLGRSEDAAAAFETALRLDPGLFEAHYFYARYSFARGDREKAAASYEAAMRARPEDYQAPLLVAQTYDYLGMPDAANEARERGVMMAEQQLAFNPDDARALYMGANGLVALGRCHEGRRWAERALEIRPNDGMLLYNIGCVYSMLGCAKEAIACLQRAVCNGVREKGWFEHDDNLDPLRADPEFIALMQQLG
jgi:adenylate cyclase